MFGISSKISYSVFIAGVFALLAFAAVNWQNLTLDTYFIMYLVLVFLMLFGFFAGRSTARPLKKIVKAAIDLADGNLQSRANVVSNDELGHLAKTLNVIAQNLQKTHEEKEQMRHSMATKVHSVNSPLHETIQALERKVKHRTMEMQRSTELSEKLQLELLLKEAEFVDLKSQLAKLMKRKSRKTLKPFGSAQGGEEA